MSLLASAVITTAIFGNVGLDADAQGRAVLAFDAERARDRVVRTVDVVDGRPAGPVRTLLRVGGRTVAGLGAVDVAPDGAAVVCVGVWDRRRTRIRAFRRAPGGAWSKAIRIGPPRRSAGLLTCAINDRGQAVVAWRSNDRVVAASVGADARVSRPRTVARRVLDAVQVSIAPDGTESALYETETRKVRIAQRTGGSWASRAPAPGDSLWPATATIGDAAPTLVPAPLAARPPGAVVASARGDLLASWTADSSLYHGFKASVSVAVQRPGGPFGAPVTLADDASWRALSLAADGTGAAFLWVGPEDHSQPVVYRLGPDGAWTPPEPLAGAWAWIAAAPGGRVTAAWVPIRHSPTTMTVGQYG